MRFECKRSAVPWPRAEKALLLEGSGRRLAVVAFAGVSLPRLLSFHRRGICHVRAAPICPERLAAFSQRRPLIRDPRRCLTRFYRIPARAKRCVWKVSPESKSLAVLDGAFAIGARKTYIIARSENSRWGSCRRDQDPLRESARDGRPAVMKHRTLGAEPVRPVSRAHSSPRVSINPRVLLLRLQPAFPIDRSAD